MTIQELQEKLPWTIKYSSDFRGNPQPHKDFAHAVVHAQKALGNLCSIIDDLDHRKESLGIPQKYIADLVICALRMANTFPATKINLEEEVINRIETKNQVKITE